MFGVPHSFYLFVFLKSIGIGFLIGVLYTFFVSLRAAGLDGTAVTLIQDILFFLLASVLSFLLLFDVNSGIFRFYILIGEGIGFVLFVLLPGNAVKNAVSKAKRRLNTLIMKNKNRKLNKKTVASRESDDI